MIPYCGQYVDSDAVYMSDETAYTQRTVVTTWSLDNVDIADNSLFPATNGTEYEFRVIANDSVDVYGGGMNATDPDNTSKFDEYVVENRVGDDKDYAAEDQNFMRDVNWEGRTFRDSCCSGNGRHLPQAAQGHSQSGSSQRSS